MNWIDWLVVIVPLGFVLYMGFRARKYVRSVADFLSAGRVCGRYVICASDVANALSIITLIGFIEMTYKSGFALNFWRDGLLAPTTMLMALSGWCIYRFRETRAMSLGQFLEMRYNRPFRIFAASLRTVSEILVNCILPALAARFFIYFLDLPHHLDVFGLQIPTFTVLILLCMTLAISIIYLGGTLAMVITDAIQGMLCFPLIAIFIVLIFYKFSWSNEIVPVMMDRVQGESFINPYDISKLRDFNLFFIGIMIYRSVFHRASWIGSGLSSAAKNPHEQKMAGVLGVWRLQVSWVFYILIGIAVITLLNHRNFAPEAKSVRDNISAKISQELIADPEQRASFNEAINAIPAQIQNFGVDKPLSQDQNLDTPVLQTAHRKLLELEGEAQGNYKFSQYQTLFHQEMVASSMRQLLPPGLMGLFFLLMVLAMISTDNSRIYSSAVTLTQDVILPLRKNPFTLKQHVGVLRCVSIGIGVVFVICSSFMAQLDYIRLFMLIMSSVWLGGCAPVMILGLYSRFGNTAGAFTSLISGMVLALGAIFLNRNWANIVYPWLDVHGWVGPVGNFLAAVSKPFNPYIVWKITPVKFPINSMELLFIISLITFFLYCVVSYFTQKEPFNLDRMLHRGKYDVDGDHIEKSKKSGRNIFIKLLGFTKEYTIGDKVIASCLFFYTFVWQFLCAFIGVIVWNAITPWPLEWWGTYFFVVVLAVPLLVVTISIFWFAIGGVCDLYRMFRDLNDRVANPLDDGRVEGHVSLADKAKIEAVEEEQAEKDK